MVKSYMLRLQGNCMNLIHSKHRYSATVLFKYVKSHKWLKGLSPRKAQPCREAESFEQVIKIGRDVCDKKLHRLRKDN